MPAPVCLFLKLAVICLLQLLFGSIHPLFWVFSFLENAGTRNRKYHEGVICSTIFSNARSGDALYNIDCPSYPRLGRILTDVAIQWRMGVLSHRRFRDRPSHSDCTSCNRTDITCFPEQIPLEQNPLMPTRPGDLVDPGRMDRLSGALEILHRPLVLFGGQARLERP